MIIGRRYNKHKILDGDIVCSQCCGTGYELPYTDKTAGYGTPNCKKCNGDGYFDWVEVIVGKTPVNNLGYSGYS